MSTHEHGLDEEDVARRAYEISTRPEAGSPEENWLRAIDELGREREALEADASEQAPAQL
jgi:hypothetical protein